MNEKPYIVSAVDVQRLLASLDGGQQISEAELWQIDPNDEAAVRKVIREHVRPLFMEVAADAARGEDNRNHWYERFKEGLRWLINLNDEQEYSWIFETGQFALAPAIGDEQKFFIWVWEELCGDEDWHIDDMSCYVENDDPYALPGAEGHIP